MSLELLDVPFKAFKAFKVHVTPEQSYEIQTLLGILKPVHLDKPYFYIAKKIKPPNFGGFYWVKFRYLKNFFF